MNLSINRSSLSIVSPNLVLNRTTPIIKWIRPRNSHLSCTDTHNNWSFEEPWFLACIVFKVWRHQRWSNLVNCLVSKLVFISRRQARRNKGQHIWLFRPIVNKFKVSTVSIVSVKSVPFDHFDRVRRRHYLLPSDLD